MNPFTCVCGCSVRRHEKLPLRFFPSCLDCACTEYQPLYKQKKEEN